MEKINIRAIDRRKGIDLHDDLRDGAAPDLDPIKVSAVIGVMTQTINQLIDKTNTMGEVIERLEKILKQHSSKVENSNSEKNKKGVR